MSEITKQTFSEWIEAGGTMPMVLDDTTWSLMQDWFQLRYVKNNFDVFLNRQVALNYPRYIQMLRVDPTSTDFDWFISQYYEHQMTNNTSNNLVSHSENASSGQTTGNTVASGTINVSGTATNTSNGTATNTSTSNGTTTDSSTNVSANNTASQNQVSSRASEQSRTNPDTVSYSDSDKEYDTELEVGGNAIESHSKGFKRPDILNPTSTSDAYTVGGTTANSDSTTQDTYVDKGTSSLTTNGTNINSSTNKGKTTNDTTSNNSIDISTVNSVEGSNDKKDSSQTDSVMREITKGYNDNLAFMAERAKNYIAGTSAWIWFYHEIDKCFIQDLEFDEV